LEGHRPLGLQGAADIGSPVVLPHAAILPFTGHVLPAPLLPVLDCFLVLQHYACGFASFSTTGIATFSALL